MGEIRLSSIEGNRQKLDGGAMFGNAPKALWSRWFSADEENRIELACRSLLAYINGNIFLFEVGIGAFWEEKLALRYGVSDRGRHVLLENLAERGVSEEDVDWVVLSHLHFDHAGGLLSLDGNDLLFPKARYVVGEEAWQRALVPHRRDRVSFLGNLVRLLEESGRLLIIKSGEFSLPGFSEISFVYSNGHTPGQMHSLICGDSQSVFFCGDLIPGCVWLNPALSMGYDRYPELLLDEKSEILGGLVDDCWLFYTHDPEYAVSRFLVEEGRCKAVEMKEELVDFCV